MWFVYVLDSLVRNHLYVGLTNDVDRRFGQHNDGKERTTRPYRPFRLIHVESFATRSEARLREKFLKSSTGKRWIRRQFKKGK
ncbi:MAG: GIY-YIG nuclease family protein [Bacteroidetes bacterium]|jgi:putative endonuclease|nr:GIY-YIG nuclease family protein [Bacteroidota bacterium]